MLFVVKNERFRNVFRVANIITFPKEEWLVSVSSCTSLNLKAAPMLTYNRILAICLFSSQQCSKIYISTSSTRIKRKQRLIGVHLIISLEAR